MNLRDLSSEVGLQAGSLYNYFQSKEGLLFRLIVELLDDLSAELTGAIEESDDPVVQLKNVVEILVIRHSRRRKEVYIGHLEMRSLPAEHLKICIEKRDRIENLVRDVVSNGLKAGRFQVPDEKTATVVIISMLVNIADWYRPNGRFTVKQLINVYTETIMKLVQVTK